MFVIAVVKKNGATRFIDGKNVELKRGYEMRLDNVLSVDFTDIIRVNMADDTYWTFDSEYWMISAVSEYDPLFDTEGA